jgi:hypothetical protein
MLLVAIVLGVWHAVLVRLGRVPGWARTAVRVGLSLLILAELARFVLMETLPWRTRGVPLGELQHTVAETMTWATWAGTASLALAAALVLALVALSVWRALKGRPVPPPLVAADPPPP